MTSFLRISKSNRISCNEPESDTFHPIASCRPCLRRSIKRSHARPNRPAHGFGVDKTIRLAMRANDVGTQISPSEDCINRHVSFFQYKFDCFVGFLGPGVWIIQGQKKLPRFFLLQQRFEIIDPRRFPHFYLLICRFADCQVRADFRILVCPRYIYHR